MPKLIIRDKRIISFLFFLFLFGPGNVVYTGQRILKIIPTLVIAQDGSGDFNGNDDKTIRMAIEKLNRTGGKIIIQNGKYLIRSTIKLPSNIYFSGVDSTILQLPEPVLTIGSADASDTFLTLSNTADFSIGTILECLPPDSLSQFPLTKIQSIKFEIKAIYSNRIYPKEPIPFPVPANSRIGYSHNVLMIEGAKNVIIENITIDGGVVEHIPMPGHQFRSAIWVTSRYSNGGGPLDPPSSDIIIRNCYIRNCYSRAIAMYNVVDSRVIGCRISNIRDEAIDFDHFSYRCRAAYNIVTNAVNGITLNDASRCIIEYNKLIDCKIGINIWWHPECPQDGLNEENIIRYNVITSVDKADAIFIGKNCHFNIVRHNFTDGSVIALE